MYADFTFYTYEYYGNVLTEDNFQSAASKASDYIDYITFGKSKDNAELTEVKKCCCALAEQFALINQARLAASATIKADGEIQSETVGAHSRTFRSGADTVSTVTAVEAELANIARRYLLPTGLLYRGGVSGVCPSCGNSL